MDTIHRNSTTPHTHLRIQQRMATPTHSNNTTPRRKHNTTHHNTRNNTLDTNNNHGNAHTTNTHHEEKTMRQAGQQTYEALTAQFGKKKKNTYHYSHKPKKEYYTKKSEKKLSNMILNTIENIDNYDTTYTTPTTTGNYIRDIQNTIREQQAYLEKNTQDYKKTQQALEATLNKLANIRQRIINKNKEIIDNPAGIEQFRELEILKEEEAQQADVLKKLQHIGTTQSMSIGTTTKEIGRLNLGEQIRKDTEERIQRDMHIAEMKQEEREYQKATQREKERAQKENREEWEKQFEHQREELGKQRSHKTDERIEWELINQKKQAFEQKLQQEKAKHQLEMLRTQERIQKAKIEAQKELWGKGETKQINKYKLIEKILYNEKTQKEWINNRAIQYIEQGIPQEEALQRAEQDLQTIIQEYNNNKDLHKALQYIEKKKKQYMTQRLFGRQMDSETAERQARKEAEALLKEQAYIKKKKIQENQWSGRKQLKDITLL